MKTLVIVDDEPSVINGLRTYVDWAGQGIELIGTADDGDTGLALISELRPDIVLTDVQMPAMDGIAMAAEVRALLPDTKIVFISGHNDAEYLRSALQMHAADYIFKPVSRKELSVVMGKVTAALDVERRERQLVKDMQVKLTQSMPLLREKFLLSVISDNIHPERVHDKLAFLGLQSLESDSYIIMVIVIDDVPQVMDIRTEQDKQLLSYTVLNIIQELIDEQMRGVTFEKEPGEYVGILLPGQRFSEDDLLQLAELIRDNLRKWLKLSVTIGVGEGVSSLSELPASYRQARGAADQKWYLGKNRILTMDNIESAENLRYRFEPEWGERVLTSIKSGDSSRLHAELAEMFGLLEKNRGQGPRYAQNVSLHLILQSGQVLLELNGMTAEWEQRELAAWKAVARQETMQDLLFFTESYLQQVCEFVQVKRSGKASETIARVRRLIEARYAENLTVADIAAGVYLSPTYVRLLFKQETGETLFEYLTKVRIEKAKQLLGDPQNKFYEVCYAVGYTDPSHFSKLFKKITGFTPSAYREQHH
ncbi:Protein-glutamate methylesterase/protein-glutamine glutaminase [Paenibacillus auburnensis]|uniref:Protein-glutamate methylesterase/protein-glutamine glutaminase n=1 Tax=Paenibacillus auburnensis TaxID=2905649 RepID=A0ABM9BP98_9BACL|nr:response regulator [Paenibacillus auburnensis]CAH1190353.1 Protein-glutamate methylesterase/protein-glutamine glutaminase [Paenibacillus auburnensis]